MDSRFFTMMILGIILLYGGMFRFKGKKNLKYKIFLITLGIFGELTVLGKVFFKETLFYPIVLISGVILMFSMLTFIVWKERKNPEKKKAVFFYFSFIGLMAAIAIIILILMQLGF